MDLVEDTLPVTLDEFLAQPLFCFLAMASPDGPRVSPLWLAWEDEAVWIIADTETKSYPARVEREPRTALAIIDFDPATGHVQHVGMRGTATLEPFDEARANRLLAKYVGKDREQWDPMFTRPWEPDRWGLIRFTPETVVARDQSYEGSLERD